MARRKLTIDTNPFAKTEPASVQSSKDTSMLAEKGASIQVPKRAATFYFASTTLEALEAAWLAARQRGEKVSKSELVERALEAWLQGEAF